MKETFEPSSSIAAAKQKKGTTVWRKLRVFPQPLSKNGTFAVRRGQDGKERERPSLMPLVPSEILLVEDELDVGLGVRQTLLLQGCPQLRGAAEEHPHLGSAGKTRTILDKHGRGAVWDHEPSIHQAPGHRRKGSSPRVLRCNIGELVVPVGLPIKRLLLEAGYRVVFRLVVNAEVSRLTEGKQG